MPDLDALARRLDAVEARLRGAHIHDPDCPSWLTTMAQRNTGVHLSPVECSCWLTGRRPDPGLLQYGEHGWPGKWRDPVPPGKPGDVWSQEPYSVALAAKIEAEFGFDPRWMEWFTRNHDGTWPAPAEGRNVVWTERPTLAQQSQDRSSQTGTVTP